MKYVLLLSLLHLISCVPSPTGVPTKDKQGLAPQFENFNSGNSGVTPPSSNNPLWQFTTPTAGQSIFSQYEAQGTCVPDSKVILRGEIFPHRQLQCATSGVFSFTFELIGNIGTKTMIIEELGDFNVIRLARELTLEKVGVNGTTTQILSPANHSTHNAQVILQIACYINHPLQLSGDFENSPQIVSCPENSSGRVEVGITLIRPDQQNQITATQSIFGSYFFSQVQYYFDATPPQLVITYPTNRLETTLLSHSASGNCSASGQMVRVSGDVAESAEVVCSPQGTFSGLNFNLIPNNGAKSLTFSHADEVGNQTVVAISMLYTEVTISGPTFVYPTTGITVGRNFNITGTCTTGVPLILILGDGRITKNCINQNFSHQAFDMVTGSLTLTAVQTINGTPYPSQINITVDATPPHLSIISPDQNTPYREQFEVRYSCTAGEGIILSHTNLSGSNINSGYSTQGTRICPASGTDLWTLAFSQNAINGPHLLTLRSTDLLNNTTEVSRIFIKDNIAPQMAFNIPPSIQTQDSITLNGSCENTILVNITGDIINPGNTPCTNQQFEYTVRLAGELGTKTVRASQTDLAQNTGFNTIELQKVGVQNYFAEMSARYTQYCMSCHQNSGQTRFSLGPDELQTANAWATMTPRLIMPGNPDASRLIQSLRHHQGDTSPSLMPISNSQFSVNDYLAFRNWVLNLDPNIGTPPSANTPSRFQQIPLMNRHFMYFKLKDIFGSNLAQESNITVTSNYNIGPTRYQQRDVALLYHTALQTSFGGNCDPYESSMLRSTDYNTFIYQHPLSACPQAKSDTTLSLMGSASPIRSGHKINICEVLVNDPASLNFALSRVAGSMSVASLPHNGAVTVEALSHAVKLFYPQTSYDLSASSPLISKLLMVGSGGSVNENWRDVFLALCISPLWEIP